MMQDFSSLIQGVLQSDLDTPGPGAKAREAGSSGALPLMWHRGMMKTRGSYIWGSARMPRQ